MLYNRSASSERNVVILHIGDRVVVNFATGEEADSILTAYSIRLESSIVEEPEVETEIVDPSVQTEIVPLDEDAA